MGRTKLACRPASYGPFEQVAYAHLAGLGIRHVEIPVPPAGSTVLRDLARHGLSASSLQGQIDLGRDDIEAQLESQFTAVRSSGANLLFISAKAEPHARDTAIDRLRRAGVAAARHGVTIALETHPDLVTNADVGRQTMEAVDQPNVRINFDTANVYFYNHAVDAVEELRKILPFVASLHLKDTDGGYRHWHFPALGRGVVNFRGIFELLDQAGFAGPCTLEIEGIEGEDKSERLVCDRIAESIGYLRGLGRL